MIDITVELTTLAGLDDHPGDLNGYGPVIADVARQVASNQTEVEHRVAVTDTRRARLSTGITRRRPTTSQRRYVQARDRTCVFPDVACPPPSVTSTTPSTTHGEGPHRSGQTLPSAGTTTTANASKAGNWS